MPYLYEAQTKNPTTKTQKECRMLTQPGTVAATNPAVINDADPLAAFSDRAC